MNRVEGPKIGRPDRRGFVEEPACHRDRIHRVKEATCVFNDLDGPASNDSPNEFRSGECCAKSDIRCVVMQKLLQRNGFRFLDDQFHQC
ncbi:MAG: hypothetical protein WB402_07670 [Sulfuricaulis sp.]